MKCRHEWCNNCRFYKGKKLRPYGMKGGISWNCPTDLCFGPDYWDINPKRERQRGREEIKEQREDDGDE